jgi:alkanesulfonate monooxygenase SsuD/methylene tetrahydromethanopterin reductase-like flavin-dependent oxidoreductase (luciferase family)
MQFNLRYDLRNPSQWRRPFERYYAQWLDQVAWADGQGFHRLSLSEHHFVEDGFVPSLLVAAAAIAARTKRIRITLNLVLLPLKHPVQVAEDAALVDIISGGRLDLVLGAGYRRNEFEGYGIPRSERPTRMEEGIEIIRRCWEEDVFSFEGKHWKLKNVRVLPKPVQRPRPKIIMGGNSEAAARRAARIADAFWPVSGRWMEFYRDELRKLGKDPGPEPKPPPPDAPPPPWLLHVARDPHAAWRRIAPHAKYEMDEYGGVAATDDPNIPMRPVADADELRRRGSHLVLTPEQTVDYGRRLERAYGPAAAMTFHPLLGGMPHELGQECLDLVAREVMPHFKR